jgi:hypothetical protein
MMDALDSYTEASNGEIALCCLCFLGSGAGGAAAGWFIVKIRPVGISFIAGTAGFFAGVQIYNLVFASWAEDAWVLILVCCACILFAASIAWKYQNEVIVYITAFLGGYALMRGASLFIGGYPNEITMITEIIAGTFEVTDYFYYYLGSFGFLTLCGIIIQHKRGYHRNDGFSKVG